MTGSITAGPRAGRSRLRPRRDSLVVVAAMGAAAALFLFYARELSALLSEAEFAAAGAILSALLALSFPLAALQAAVAREVAERRAAGDREGEEAALAGARRLALRSALASAAVAAAGLGFGIPPAPAVLALAVSVPALCLYAVALGALLGGERLGPFAATAIAEPALRIVVARSLVSLGLGAAGAVGACAVTAGGVGMVVLARLPRSSSREGPAFVALRHAAVLAAYGIAAYATPVLAFGLLDPVEGGRFAAASQVSRFLVTLPLPFSMALVRRVAERRATGRSVGPPLWIALAFLLVTFAWILGNLAYFPAQFLRVLVDPTRYEGIEPRLLPLAIGSALYGLLQVPLFFEIALRRSRVAFVLGALLLGLVLYGLFGPASWEGIVLVWAGGGALALAASLVSSASAATG